MESVLNGFAYATEGIFFVSAVVNAMNLIFSVINALLLPLIIAASNMLYIKIRR